MRRCGAGPGAVSRRRAGLRFDDGRDRRRRPYIIIGSTSSSTRRSSIRAVHIRGLVPHVPTRFQIRHSRVAVICRETLRRRRGIFRFFSRRLEVRVRRRPGGAAVRPGWRESVRRDPLSYVCRIDKTRRVSRHLRIPRVVGFNVAPHITGYTVASDARAQRDASTTRAASRPGAPPRAHARTPGGRTAGARLHARRSACARSDQFTSAAAQSSTTCRPRQTQPRRTPPRAATSAADRRKSARSRAPGA